MQQQEQAQGQWVIGNSYTGEIAEHTSRYESVDEAAQVLYELVEQGRLPGGDWEVRMIGMDGVSSLPFGPEKY